MGKLLILSSAQINNAAGAGVIRGTGSANLLTHDPKEVWTDSIVAATASIEIDLGSVQPVNCVSLSGVYDAAAAATWSIQGGVADYAESTLKATGPLRAIDVAATFANPTHAFWSGTTVNVRFLRISVFQPAGHPVLKVGRVMAGSAFTPTFNKEWGSGRGIVDTGSATRLPSGGVAMVEGARFGTYAWTLGDLTDAEVEVLYGLQKDVGETLPVLVVEDPDAVAGQANRIHYGCLTSLRKFERRSPNRTRWEFTMEEWI